MDSTEPIRNLIEPGSVYDNGGEPVTSPIERTTTSVTGSISEPGSQPSNPILESSDPPLGAAPVQGYTQRYTSILITHALADVPPSPGEGRKNALDQVPAPQYIHSNSNISPSKVVTWSYILESNSDKLEEPYVSNYPNKGVSYRDLCNTQFLSSYRLYQSYIQWVNSTVGKDDKTPQGKPKQAPFHEPSVSIQLKSIPPDKKIDSYCLPARYLDVINHINIIYYMQPALQYMDEFRESVIPVEDNHSDSNLVVDNPDPLHFFGKTTHYETDLTQARYWTLDHTYTQKNMKGSFLRYSHMIRSIKIENNTPFELPNIGALQERIYVKYNYIPGIFDIPERCTARVTCENYPNNNNILLAPYTDFFGKIMPYSSALITISDSTRNRFQYTGRGSYKGSQDEPLENIIKNIITGITDRRYNVKINQYVYFT